MILCYLDALDYTRKWLEDTVKCMSESGMEGSSAASSDPSSLLPLCVHNHAYLRLLRWDHESDPFPEVHTISPVFLINSAPCHFFKVICCVCIYRFYLFSLYVYRQY